MSRHKGIRRQKLKAVDESVFYIYYFCCGSTIIHRLHLKVAGVLVNYLINNKTICVINCETRFIKQTRRFAEDHYFKRQHKTVIYFQIIGKTLNSTILLGLPSSEF